MGLSFVSTLEKIARPFYLGRNRDLPGVLSKDSLVRSN